MSRNNSSKPITKAEAEALAEELFNHPGLFLSKHLLAAPEAHLRRGATDTTVEVNEENAEPSATLKTGP